MKNKLKSRLETKTPGPAERAKTCPNPKWGTVEWIRVYPWSLMDRKRRKRVKAILPPELVELLDMDVGRVPFLHAVAKRIGDRGTRTQALKALARVDQCGRFIVDCAVASALAEVWLRRVK